jgi:ribosome-binding factor A
MAKPSYPRARRLAETVRRLVGEWLEAEQADQPGPLVTVTDVRVTGDLHHASVFFTVLGDDAERADAEAWVASSATRARTFVASQLRLRQVPTLEFVPDAVPGQGARIDRLLAELGSPPEGSGEPRGGAPVGRAGSGEPRGGAPVGQSPDQEGSGA